MAPDIGELNIRISSESTQAEQGLNRVAGALERIKGALSKANLGGVATALGRINQAINGIRVDGTIENLNGLAAALKRVQEASDFKSPGLKGVQNLQKSVGNAVKASESITKATESVENAQKSLYDMRKDAASSVSPSFESIVQMNREMHEKYKLDPEARREYNMQSAWHYISRETDPRVMEAMAKASGFTLQEVLDRFAKVPENVNIPQEALAQQTGTSDAEGIQNATQQVRELTTSVSEAQRKVNELFETFNRPAQTPFTNYADYINQTIGIGAVPKSAEDSMSVFLEGMEGSSQTAHNLQANNPELAEFKQQLDEAGISAHEFNSKLVDVDGELKSKKKDASEAGGAFEGLKSKFSGVGKVLDRVGRMLSMMVIRTALKSLIKSLKSSWEAMYNFSKASNGVFAQSIDKIKGLFAASATNVLKTFAPAIEAIVPIVNVVASAIQYLCNIIQKLFSLLGISSDLWGASADSINKYSKAAGGGSSKTKEILASFDELNVISSQGGGGGGGGAGGLLPGGISDAVSDEMAKLQMIVGESLLAIGLIMAMAGHVPLGVGLMAIGAAAIVKTIVNDWGKLSSDTQAEIAKIMAYCSVGFLGLGFILAATGHIGLGIGMMALGAANMAGLVAMGFNDMLTDEIKAKVTKILGIGGSLLFVSGLILAMTGNLPLGIGLMVAGAAAVGSAVALNWDTIIEKVKSVFGPVKEFLIGIWGEIEGAVTNAWNAVSEWWSDTAVPWIKGVWESVSGWFVDSVWNPIAKAATNAWNTVSEWWSNTIQPLLSGVWTAISGWFDRTVWTPIKEAATTAWGVVSDWWSRTISPRIKRIWNTVSGWFEKNVWTPISQAAQQALDVVAQWWNDDIQPLLSGVWTAISGWFNRTVWTPISEFAKAAWEVVEDWWKTNIEQKLSAVWSTVSTWFYDNVWKPIEDNFNSLWSILGNLWGEITNPLKTAWDGVVSFFDGIFGPIIEKATSLYNVLKHLLGWEDLPETTTYHVVIEIETVVKNAASSLIQGFSEGIASNISSLYSDTLKNNLKLATTKTVYVKASGDYDISRGELFIANEAGPELVGTINGKTSVANQNQIVDGISKGVADANQEQNNLLKRQNDLLIQIGKEILQIAQNGINIKGGAGFGRTISQSLDAYNSLSGR